MKFLQLIFYLLVSSLVHVILLPLTFLKHKFFRAFKLSVAPRVEGGVLSIIPSAGELEYIKPILEDLRRDSTNLNLAYFSPSYESHVEKNKKLFHSQFKLPFDSIFALPLYLCWKPELILVSRMQVWPLFLFVCNIRKIPCFMISANFQGTTLNTSFKQFLFKPWLSLFSKIYLENEEDVKISFDMGLKNATWVGNPRVDTVIQKQKMIKDVSWLRPWLDRPIVILASIWHSDLKIIEKDYLKLIEQGFKIILVPHEYDKSYNPKEVDFFYSKDKKFESQSFICVVNEVGLLFDLYQYAKYVFVGGGFGRDVHSTLEPASFGLPLCFGPNIFRSVEAQVFVKLGGAKIITRPLEFCLENMKDLDGGKNRKYLESQAGGVAKISNEIRKNLI